MTDDTRVHLTVAAGVATVTLDSPAHRNALSARLRAALIDRLDAAIADDSVRVIVLTHTGPVFCAGLDLTEAHTDATRPGVLDIPRILQTLWESPTPVIARLAGHARAGGVGIVAACDIVLTADTVTFAFPEVRVGLLPAVISATVLRRVQPQAAHALFLTGETFSASRAAEIGLVDRVVAPVGLDDEVARQVAMLQLGSPRALAGVKRHLRPPGSLAAELSRLDTLSADWFTGPDGREGIRAFVEKRPPAWVVPTADHEPGGDR